MEFLKNKRCPEKEVKEIQKDSVQGYFVPPKTSAAKKMEAVNNPIENKTEIEDNFKTLKNTRNILLDAIITRYKSYTQLNNTNSIDLYDLKSNYLPLLPQEFKIEEDIKQQPEANTKLQKTDRLEDIKHKLDFLVQKQTNKVPKSKTKKNK